jgi:hypothetical protein
MPSFVIENKEGYLEWLEGEYAKLEKLGSQIFPMKGNEDFETIKSNVKTQMKAMRKVIKAIKAGETRVEL